MNVFAILDPMKKRAGIFLAALLVFCLHVGPVQAQEKAAAQGEGTESRARFEMEEVVVTAAAEEEPLRNIPKNVTVITAEDIQQATSNNVADLLGRESGVQLRSFFGHDKRAGIDIRGMGDTSVSNVLVMVDGFRLNSPDLAGPDFSSIPLDQIERIEIVRSAGSVLYGDGAVGGVVNIITKKGEKEPEIHLYSTYGSYETSDTRSSAGGRMGNARFNVNADYFSSGGYRDNGFSRKKDLGLSLGYDMGDRLSAGLTASFHEGRSGLPGPLGLENLYSKDRRVATKFPHDFSETLDRRFTGRMEVDLGAWGLTDIHTGYRDRENDFIIGFNDLIDPEAQVDTIEEGTWDVDLRHLIDYDLWGLGQRLSLGLDYYRTDYVREDRFKERKNSDTKALDWFVQQAWALPHDLAFQAGYRRSRYEGLFRTDTYQNVFNPNPPFNFLSSHWVEGNLREKIWKNKALDLGLTFRPVENTGLFIDYARSFRNPNVDELALAIEDLSPQKGRHWDVGVRREIGYFMEASVTLFQIQIEDEIFFGKDPDTGMQFNRNLDETTRRRGIEMDVKLYPLDVLYLWGNYTYMEARFEDKGTDVPHVPRHKASLGVEWHILEPLLLSLTGTHVGSRFDGNDEDNNQFRKLEAYRVMDAKLSYRRNRLQLFVGVNNLFNELYSTLSFSETVYPMPERHFYGGLSWTF